MLDTTGTVGQSRGNGSALVRVYNLEEGRVDDLDGFTSFYTAEHGRLVTAVRITLGDVSLAREAVDEAFTRAAERWSSVRQLGNQSGWVYRVAINWATSWRRKLALRPTRAVEALDRAHHDPIPDVDLAAALARLPVDHRTVLVLRYAFGYSVLDVADVLGISDGTVKSRVHRARQQLLLTGWWHDDTSPDGTSPDGRSPDGAVGAGPDAPSSDALSSGEHVDAPGPTRPSHSEVFDGPA